MGLDTVELVIRFEEAFGITIPDEDAERLATPREVTNYIMSRVVLSSEPACLSQQAFYFLREKFVPRLHLNRNAFRPKHSLENVIPKENRKHLWASLTAEVGGALPELARPVWLLSILAFITTGVFAYATYYAEKNIAGGYSLVFGSAMAILFAYGSTITTRPFKQNFRRGDKSVGDIVKYLISNSPHTFKKQSSGWTREQVAFVVREIIIDVTGITDFTEDSHFIRDLHLD
jgi:hypothetical protein